MKKKDDVKEKILQESIKLFLARGFSGSATNELVRLAGVSKGALYWHFKDKEDILNHILDRYTDTFIKEAIRTVNDCTGNFSDKFRQFYRFTSEFSRDNRELLLAVTTLLVEFAGTGSELERRMKEINIQYTMIIQKLIEDGIKEGTVRKEIDPVIYSRFIASALMGSHIQWYLYISSYEDDPAFNRQHAIIQRNELLNILLSKDSSLPG
jgi:AcrR family transcriptional regulator